jgi:hypothetical protein
MTQIPDFFHALIGWRKFEFAVGGRVLTSAGHTDHWWPMHDLGEALCRATGDHDAPQLQCSCGFYCYKTREDAQQHAQGSILAKVEVWGRLAEHTRGYRAQHMKILELFVSPSFSARSSLETRYHVPVTVDEGASTWISENPYGSSSPNPFQNPYQSRIVFAIHQQAFLYNQNSSQQLSALQNAAQNQLLQQYAVQQAQAQLVYNQNYIAGNYIAGMLANQNSQAAAGLLGGAIAATPQIGKTIQVRLGKQYTVKGTATTNATPVKVNEPAKATPPPSTTAEPDPLADPVADRVNKRLQEK